MVAMHGVPALLRVNAELGLEIQDAEVRLVRAWPPAWRRSLKFELEALANKDFQFLTKTYLPRKLKQEGWLDPESSSIAALLATVPMESAHPRASSPRT